MRVSLKLTGAEVRGLGYIVNNGLRAIAVVDLYTLQCSDALYGLQLKLAARLPRLKAKGNRMTLTEVESLALWDVMNDLVEMMQPYEQGLAYRLIAEIERQRMDYLRQLRYNAGEQQQYQLK